MFQRLSANKLEKPKKLESHGHFSNNVSVFSSEFHFDGFRIRIVYLDSLPSQFLYFSLYP